MERVSTWVTEISIGVMMVAILSYFITYVRLGQCFVF